MRRKLGPIFHLQNTGNFYCDQCTQLMSIHLWQFSCCFFLLGENLLTCVDQRFRYFNEGSLIR